MDAATRRRQNQEFISACGSLNVRRARQCLQAGADVNFSLNCSALQIAASNNNEELLELLLEQPGLEVNKAECQNETALMAACSQGHDKMVRRLCQIPNIALNHKGSRGGTALHFAIHFNRAGCVKALREVGGLAVDWNLRDGVGNDCPVTRAVSRGAADILETILTVPSPPLHLEVMDSCGRGLAQIAVETVEGESERCEVAQ